jgi:putative ABC transport system ATP-binding protein
MPAEEIPSRPEAQVLESLESTLEQLCRLTGLAFDPTLARQAARRALDAHPGSEPSARFEQLTAAASECCLRVTTIRLPLADAVWRARPDSPLVVVPRTGPVWRVLARRGTFHLKVAHTDGRPGHTLIRREALARELGLSDSQATVDLAVVHPERPVATLDGKLGQRSGGHGGKGHDHEAGDHGGHHHSDHAHPEPHHRLAGLMRAEMPDVWAVVLFSVITGILYLAVPLTVDAVVNNIAFGGQQVVYIQALTILSVALLAFLGLLAFARGVQHYLAEVIQRRIFVRLTADLAYRLPRVTASSLDRVHAPELVNRFFDVVTVQKATSLLLLDGVNVVLAGVIGMVVLGFYHPFLLAFDLVLLLLVCLVIFGAGRGAVRTSIAESVSKYAVADWLEQLAQFPNLFKGPGGAQFALDRADHLARIYLDARKTHFRILIRQIGGFLALQALASSVLLVVGGVLVLQGELTLGQLVASELIVNAVLTSVAKLGKHLEAWYDAMAAVDKLGYLVDLQTEPESGEVPVRRAEGAAVHAASASAGYDPHHPLFQDVTFRLEPGTRAAVVGPEGCGVSALLDLFFGLRPAAAGHVTVDELDLRQWSVESLRRDVALVRHHDFVDGTLVENLRLGRTDVGLDDVREALEQVGMLAEALAMPDGLETRIRTGGRPLTTLQRTRLILARALIGRPRLLLLDEVLDGIDPEAFEQLSRLIFDPQRRWTVLIATRDPELIRRCSQVIQLAPCRLNHPANAHAS